MLEVLPKRFGKYGLTLHPDKTRLVRFQPARRADSPPGESAPSGPGRSTSWGSPTTGVGSRKGNWVVKRQDGRETASAALCARSSTWCREHRH